MSKEKKFEEAMEDDFNTADALAAVFELVKFANTNVTEESSAAFAEGILEILVKLCDVLGLAAVKKEEILDKEIEDLIAERQEARKAKNFARADETDKSAYEEQYRRYKEFLGYLEELGVQIPIRHCSNSAGIVESLESNHMDMVRAGIAIYGMYPSDEVDHNSVKLTPAMEIKSCITYIKEIGAGTAVSYGGTFVADHTMKVATIPVGYGDGYVRSLSGKGDVLIRGKRAAILGRICMDQFMVDVTDIPDVQEDDEVTLLGKDGSECITMEELAEKSGGFHYEMVCDIGKRIPRVYLKDGNIVGTKDYFDDVFKEFA